MKIHQKGPQKGQKKTPKHFNPFQTTCFDIWKQTSYLFIQEYPWLGSWLGFCLSGWLNDKVSGQTTGPILMPFCIRTTYWSLTCLHVFFFKNLKKCGNAAQICIFRVLLHIYLQKYAKLLDRFWCPFAYELHIGLRRDSAYFFSKISKYGNPAHTYAYFAFYTITQKLLNQIWPDFTYSFLDGFLNFL